MASFPAPTIVRIKRRLNSESSETIIVSTKRQRLDCGDGSPEDTNPIPEICTAILKKLATLKQGDSLEIEAKKALENEPKHSWDLKESYKKGFTSSAKDMIHRKSKSDVSAIRFKLVCTKRNLEESGSKESDFHMFDALKEKEENALVPIASSSSHADTDVISCNGIPMESEKIEFVYDLYYTSIPVEVSSWINNICEIQRYNALDYREESSKIDEDYEDDSDENSESNWRNDYPDEEDAKYYEDEDQFLCAELEKKATFSADSSESFDEDDYDESGDFDDEGGLIMFKTSRSVFGLDSKRKARAISSESEEESD